MAQSSSENTPQSSPGTPPAPSKNRTGAYVGIGVAVAVIVIVAALALGGVFTPKASNNGGGGNSPPAPQTVTVVGAGTVYNLNQGQYEGIGPVALTTASSWTITGTFTATNSGATAYVMTSSQYSSWGGSGTPSAYYWTSGPGVLTGSINTNLPAGTYYFVWENAAGIFGPSTSVDITSAVVATS